MAKRFVAGWRQVIIGMVLLAVTALIATTYSVIAVPFAQEFKPSRMVLMLAMTILSASSALLSPLLGSLMDRLPLRLMAAAGALLICAGYVALSFVHSFNHVLIIFGLLIAPANVLLGPLLVTVLISRWFIRARGAAIGVAIAGIGLGGLVFPPIVQMLLNHFDWRTALQLLALLLAVILLPVIGLMVERPSDRGLIPDGEPMPEGPALADAPPPVLPSRLAILANNDFWLVILFTAVVTSGLKGMATNLVPLAVDEKISATAAAFLLSVYSGSAMIGKLCFAALADRFSPRAIAAACLGGFALGMALMTQANGTYALLAGSVGVIGVFGGLMMPLQSFLLPRIFGAHVVGRVGGLMNMLTMVALLITPPLFGRIYDVTGNYDAIFFAFTVLAALCLLLVSKLRLNGEFVR